MAATGALVPRVGADTSKRVIVRRTAAGLRQGAFITTIVGLIDLAYDVVPGVNGANHLISIGLDSSLIVFGLVLLRFHKARILQGPVSLVMVVYMLTMVGVNNYFGLLPPATYGIWFMVILVWVGMWNRSGTAALMSPVVAASYLIPLFARSDHSSSDILAAILVVPMAVLTGEVVAWYSERARRAEAGWARLLNDLSRETTTDPLTGVGNRRLGDMLLESLKAGDAVAIVDFDHFKLVNDRSGHLEGDRQLQLLAQHLKSGLREEDSVARMGGEEFLLVLRGAHEQAFETIDRLRETWRERGPNATLSAGVAVHQPHARGTATYKAADEALYSAKEGGRNRTVLGRQRRSVSRPAA